MSILKKVLAALGLGSAAPGARRAVPPKDRPHPPRTAPAAPAPPPTFDATPDRPVSFGYKINWFAVRSEDPQAVAAALGLSGLRPANWATGVAAAYGQGASEEAEAFVFLSPPVRGWVFAASGSLPYPDRRQEGERHRTGRRFDSLLAALAQRFPDVQFFGSYRVVSFCAWACARGGKVQRAFSYADGEVLANVGPQSAEERSLRFLDLSGLSPEDATTAIFDEAERRDEREQALAEEGMDREAAGERLRSETRDPIPDEDDPLALAAAWSLDPNTLEELDLPPSAGFVAALPEAMRQ